MKFISKEDQERGQEIMSKAKYGSFTKAVAGLYLLWLRGEIDATPEELVAICGEDRRRFNNSWEAYRKSLSNEKV